MTVRLGRWSSGPARGGSRPFGLALSCESGGEGGFGRIREVSEVMVVGRGGVVRVEDRTCCPPEPLTTSRRRLEIFPPARQGA